MKIFIQNLLLACGALFTNAVFCVGDEANAKRFVVVSGKVTAVGLYPLPPNLRSAEDTDLATKKKICDDILSTEQFARDDEYPYEKESVSCFQGFLLNEKKNYSPRLIQYVKVDDEQTFKVDETVFVCLVRTNFMPCKRVDEYYVSSEYRLYAKSDDPDAGYVGVRFVFEYLSYNRKGGIIGLHKVAETPAEVYQLSPRFPHIEHVYLDRREDFMPTFRRRNDSLCQLTPRVKLRICLAVFNSSYFDGKVEFPVLRVSGVEGTCERKTVSFRTDSANDEAKVKKRKYEEWMMSCRPNEYSYTLRSFDYLLSSAYVNNEIWVYARHPETEQASIEILATNVRISIDQFFVRKRARWDTDDDYKYDVNERDDDD